TQQSPESELEVAERQAVQVELGQELAHLLRTSLEEREHTTLEPLLQPANPRPPHRDRAVRQGQLPRLPVTVAVHPLRAELAPFRPPSAQQPIDLLLEQPLDESLNLGPGEVLQLFPHLT